MGKSNIATRVRKIICEQLGRPEDEITGEKNLVNDLGADSLDLTELVMAIEDEFGIDVPDGKAREIVTVADAINYVENAVE